VSAARLILLVDDDPDLLIVLAGELRRRGYDVATALDAVAAMTAAVKLKPQAIVLDVGLPGGEGPALMRRMRALPQLAGMPVVMMSGRDPERYRDEALASGASAYLTKPVRADELVAALRTAMGEDDQAEGGGPTGPYSSWTSACPGRRHRGDAAAARAAAVVGRARGRPERPRPGGAARGGAQRRRRRVSGQARRPRRARGGGHRRASRRRDGLTTLGWLLAGGWSWPPRRSW
jgi:DNA-binding response OmpR family regulator